MRHLNKFLLLLGILVLTSGLLMACNTLPELPTRTPQAEAPESEAEVEGTAAEAPPAQVATGEEVVALENISDNLSEIASILAAQESAVQGREGGLATSGAATKAVDLLGAWVSAGAPESDSFEYEGMDSNTYQATFEVDIKPLFTEKDIWYDGSRACDSCHFANSEASNHEMDLSTYDGILSGADVLEEPPGVPILGQSGVGETDFDWENSKLHARLRNNRMPPGWEFDATEANRDGYCVEVSDDGITILEGEYGCELNAVSLIASWVDAGVPESDAFEYGGAQLTFQRDVQPFFSEDNMWFDGSQACTGCHFGNSENSYHEMDLSSYEGILAGADVLEEPPGVPILGQSESGSTDTDWENSKLHARLRNNRMPPGWEFDITEENRDGPYVLHGQQVNAGAEAGQPPTEITTITGTPNSVTVVKTTVVTGPDGTTTTTTETTITRYGEGDAATTACAINAVDLLGTWVNAGAPETDSFDYISASDESCSGTFEADVLPLFTENGAWYEGSQACTGCHFANTENSYHEMDLSSYEGILTGADALEEPPGVPILGQSAVGETDYDWDHSELRVRLRNNRMPPGWDFDITEENRDGPTLLVNGTEVRAVNLIGDWVNVGAPETDSFGDYNATFEENVLPLFTEEGAWFEGSQACTGCHFANTENSYHEMDLSTYEGILTGADALEEPPGVPILGQSAVGETDYDWEHSELRARLRDNRMPPGWEFDITEANRDGPLVLYGQQVAAGEGGATAVAASGTGKCEVAAVTLISAWVEGGAPEMEPFDFTALDGGACEGTFETDVLPLFTENGAWFEGSQACTGCHFANTENSYHEMDLSSYEGILTGADALEEPPGVPILGQSAVGETDYDWETSKLHARLRNNRMPPGWEFDITEENRDGPMLTINGVEVRAVDLIGDWVNAGVPELDPFGDYNATFEGNVLPLFTEDGAWFEGSQACTGCHFANTENSYHEMDLSSYEGILTGADALEEPPGVPILGQSAVGETDYDWEHSELRARLRNNRMPPGWEFDITEANRDGPIVRAGKKK